MLGNIYHLTFILLRFIIIHKTKAHIWSKLTITFLLNYILFTSALTFSSFLTRLLSTSSYRCLESVSLLNFLLNLLTLFTSLRILVSFSYLGVLNRSLVIISKRFFLTWSIFLSLLRQPIINSCFLILLLFGIHIVKILIIFI